MRRSKNLSPFNFAAKLVSASVPAALLLVGVSAAPTQAAGIVFNYNSSSLYSTSTAAPSSGADNSGTATTGVQGYMDTILHTYDTNWNVAVSGAQSSGTNTGGGYVGDGYVVYCANSVNSCSPTKEANLSNLYSTPFIETSGAYSSAPGNSGKAAIKMAFSSSKDSSDPVKVTSLSFDFEIFPNGAGVLPDFTFILTSGGSTIINETIDSSAPASSATLASGGVDTNGSFTWSCTNPTTKSPNDPTLEANKQCTGNMDFTFATAISDPTLYFVDWPGDVAVTNIDWGVPLPEPTTLALLGSSLIGLGMIRRRRRK